VRRFVALLVALLVGSLAVDLLALRQAAAVNHSYDVIRHTYDVPTLVRVALDETSATGAHQSLRSAGREASAAIATRTLGRSTTPVAPVAATNNPLANIPENAEVRVLKPDPNGGAQYGVKYKWTNPEGQTVRFRAHGPDVNAPLGSNAAAGDVYRVQVGGRYMDETGHLHPRGVHNPRSPNYEPAAANATHMPFIFGLPGVAG
jgi:hypothetical protein